MRFYVGLHNPGAARHFLEDRVMVSVKRLWDRKGDFSVGEWMLDSGAFSELKDHGRYRYGVEEYAARVHRWAMCGNLAAAVSQDYMCEPMILKETGLTVPEHQRLTLERYKALLPLCRGVYLLPVLQGYWPSEYVEHLRLYGGLLREGQWVGVGSVCKRNARVDDVEQVLMTIRRERPDLRLHGFGLKTTALESSVVRNCLYSADSMAWSDAARKQATTLLMRLRREFGRNIMPKDARAVWASRGVFMPDANDWREARAFADSVRNQRIRERAFQGRMFA